ncbi:cation:proton antiporter [Sulfuriflexus sp.]|uniref:cation:proton antiporter n=1 Tax=Sulfuriflexus sp. TaxID=2015443 RepID=UPI0028CE02D8|nr:cation:proton antiporter [Sulfuriflexus sp.]MDT8404925.1 cation:proton antiporter [Sulfuriflexus sp.]
MQSHPVIFTIFLIFAGAAALATVALYARLSLLIVYIALGVLLGPFGINIISDPELIQGLSHVGIIFLLFLLGMNLQPQKLLQMLRETLLVTGVSSVLFLGLGAGIALLFGYALTDSFVIGAAMMFSSTIIALKLLPTTVLHHQRMGEIIISVLLLQDILAILILMLLPADWVNSFPVLEIFKLLGSLLGLSIFAWAFARFVLFKLIARFDRIQEYIFLLTIGWCLSMAELAVMLGLSAEIGAFIGGIALATHPIALYIGESLKPLRDFFLVIFFFALGASFDLGIVEKVWLPALVLTVAFMLIKPLTFKWLLSGYGETAGRPLETGVRLGQISEFSLFIAVLALQLNVISTEASYLIQVATLMSFLVSSWFIVMSYPTPMATSDKLRRD